MSNYIRFLAPKRKNVNCIIKNYEKNLNINLNFPADTFFGFNTTDNSLSVFEYFDINDKELIFLNYIYSKNKFNQLDSKLQYIEFDTNFINTLCQINIKQTPLTNTGIFSNFNFSDKHYDLIDLNKDNISFFIYNLQQHIFNQNIVIHDLKPKEIISLIKKYLSFINDQELKQYLSSSFL